MIRHIIIYKFFFIALFWVSQAQAGYLTIDANSSITTNVKDQQISLTGFYEITNHGNERAQKVFPQMQLGKWEWAGKAVNLEQNAKQRWELDLKIPLNMLDLPTLMSSSNVAIGEVPLLVLKHYQDLNGFDFSATEVIILNIGNLSEDQQSQVRIPRVIGSFSCDGNGQDFDCDLALRNLSVLKKNITLRIFTSQELESKLEREKLEIPESQQAQVEALVKNISALSGNSYTVYAIVSWTEFNLQRIQVLSSKIKIENHSLFAKFIWPVIFIIITGYLIHLLIRRNRKTIRLSYFFR